MKLFIFVVILALLGWWGYNHGYIKPEWLGAGSASTPSSGAQGESLQAALNRGLPRMVSGEISLDRAAANRLAVSFEYRLVDLDEYAVAQRYGSTLPAEMQSQLFRDLCNNRAVREQVLAKGRDVQVQVRSQNGRTMYSTQLKPGGC